MLQDNVVSNGVKVMKNLAVSGTEGGLVYYLIVRGLWRHW
jgi:hypothetical protein